MDRNNAFKKRVRTRSNNRWSDGKTEQLLNMILAKIDADPAQFEKPTKRAFYEAAAKCVPSLQTIEWDLISNKMRNLRVSYMEAKSLRDAAADIDQWNEQDIEEQVKRKCPFFEQLHNIYGTRHNASSEKDETSLGYEANFDVHNEASGENNAEKGRAEESFENCADALLVLLEEDFAELENVKQEKEDQEEEVQTDSVLLEKILMTDEFKILPTVDSKHFWTDDQTKALLESVLDVIVHDAAAFQETTPQSFYEKILERCSEIGHRINWTVARSKMAELRASYVAAGALLKQQSGAHRLDDEALNEEIHHVCPFFDLLHQIFGRVKSLETIESAGLSQIKSDLNEHGSSESEGAYPFENEEEIFKASTEPKTRRLRLKPNHSWTRKATKNMLRNIVKETNEDPAAFEKPTAQIFYRRVFPQVSWQLCRSKMRNLRRTYQLAHEFRDQNAGADKGEEDWVREKVKKICPVFGLMNRIFFPRSKFSVETHYDDDDDEDESDDDEGDEISPPPSKRRRRPPATKVNKNQTKKEVVMAEEEEKEDQEVEQMEQTFVIESPQSSSAQQAILETTPNWAFKREKLKLEREKVLNDLEIRKLQLQHQFDIRKLEVERDERLAMAKLKFETEERIKKYELELQLRDNSRFLNL